MQDLQFSVTPLGPSESNAAPGTMAHTEVAQGGDAYPGVQLINTDGVDVPPLQVTVTLPDWHGLHYPNWVELYLSITNPPSDAPARTVAGVLSADGKTLTFYNVDLKLHNAGDQAILWVPVHADADAVAGDTSLAFTIGSQGQFQAPLKVKDASPPPPPPPPAEIKYGDKIYLQNSSLYLNDAGGGRVSAVSQPSPSAVWTILDSNGGPTGAVVRSMDNACLMADNSSYLVYQENNSAELGSNRQQAIFMAVALREADTDPIDYDSPMTLLYGPTGAAETLQLDNGQVDFGHGAAVAWSATKAV